MFKIWEKLHASTQAENLKLVVNLLFILLRGIHREREEPNKIPNCEYCIQSIKNSAMHLVIYIAMFVPYVKSRNTNKLEVNDLCCKLGSFRT